MVGTTLVSKVNWHLHPSQKVIYKLHLEVIIHAVVLCTFAAPVCHFSMSVHGVQFAQRRCTIDNLQVPILKCTSKLNCAAQFKNAQIGKMH